MFIGRKILVSVRYRILALALVPLLSVLTLFTPFFTGTAAALSYDDVLTRARAWSILNAVIDEASYLDSTISNSDADKCHIFGSLDNDSIYVGHHTTGNSSTGSGPGTGPGSSWDALEGQVNLATNALTAVGINGGCRGLLEKLGYTPGGGNMNSPGNYSNGDARVRDKLRAAVKDDAFFGAHIGDGAPGDAISYAILYYNLKNICAWSYRNPYVENDKSDTEEGRRNREAQSDGWGGEIDNAHFHTYTYELNKTGEYTYYKQGGTTSNIYVGSKSGFAPSGDNNAQLECGNNTANTFGSKLHDHHQYADAFANLVRPGGANTPGTCLERFPDAAGQDPARITALRNACDEGFKNKGNEKYCTDKFSGDAQLLDACRYGQTTATGGANATTTPENTDQPKEDKTSCAIQAIGWIICPVVNFMAAVVDGAYAFVSSLLKVEPIIGNGDGTSGIYQAWEVMRNFANIAFVVAFLIIIFSQITSVGISNYGIKKMLPRLVVAAILVNVSFWVCAIAVDLSNIFGVSLKNLFDAIGAKLDLPNFHSFGSTANGWAGLAGTILAGTAITVVALYAQLSALLPMLVVVLFAIVTVFIVLTLRQALIILLIVVSPLAFVAFLLPNTQNLFKKWKDTFQVLLLMYPIISLIFGASALASKIVMGTAQGDYKIIVQIMGAAISIIPLFITPILMKVSGGILNRVGGVINNPNKGPFDRMRKGAERIAGDEKLRRQTRAMNGTPSRFPGFMGRIQGAGYRRGARTAHRSQQLQKNLNSAQKSYLAGQVQNNANYANSLAGGNRLTGNAADPAALSRALATALKESLEEKEIEVKAAHAQIDNANLSQDSIANLARGIDATDSQGRTISGADAAVRAAAIQQTIATHNISGINQLLNDSASGTMEEETRRDFADALQKDGSRPAYISNSAIGEIRQHGNIDPTTGAPVQAKSSNELVINAVNNNTYSAEKIAKGDREELEHVAAIAVDPTLQEAVLGPGKGVSTAGKAALNTNAHEALTSDQLKGSVGKNRTAVETLETI